MHASGGSEKTKSLSLKTAADGQQWTVSEKNLSLKMEGSFPSNQVL